MNEKTKAVPVDAESSRPRVRLVRTGPCDWVIVEHARGGSDERAVIASIHDIGDDVAVDWHGDVPLGTQYVTAEAALDDIRHWLAHRRGGLPPKPIPHFPPVPLN